MHKHLRWRGPALFAAPGGQFGHAGLFTEAGEHGDVHADVEGQVACRPELAPATGVVTGEGAPVVDYGGDAQEGVSLRTGANSPHSYSMKVSILLENQDSKS
ncbi:hypothetical protein [Ktedonobacter sp. SOSP1-85]|uniref:hypothetical protein n=1 Tax=Ktedonobacter sp. SOSP1-85 TaxID=2778367 RepID=UPI001915EEB5|nr:hypothetical protein [Ktedonobacter sp. SOSP1-85]